MDQRLPESEREEGDFTFVSQADKDHFIELFINAAQLHSHPSQDPPRIPMARKRLDPVRIAVWPSRSIKESENFDLFKDTLSDMIWIQQQLELDPQLTDPEEPGWNYGMVVYTTADELEASAQYFANEGMNSFIRSYAEEIRKGSLPLEMASNTMIVNYSEGPEKGAITETLTVLPLTGPRPRIEANFTLQVLMSLGLNEFKTGQVNGFTTFLDRRQMLTQGTETDLNLLRTLYHPALKPGMDEAQVRAVLDEILLVQ